jgi:hypothetical protein
MASDYLTPAYYRRKPAASGWSEVEPPPEVTTRDARPPDAPSVPSAVLKLQRAAEGAGWTILTGYSRGPERAVRVGTYKLTEAYGVYADRHPGSGWRFAALYARTVGAKSWAWRSIAIRRPGHLVGPGLGAVFVHATITDLHEFIAVRGDVGTPWFKAVQARVEDAAVRARAAARTRPSTHKEGSS